MPEVVTKHPDVVKEVLESAGAKCGAGAPQKILTKCPREHFCALPGGEICVYAPGDVANMTQLSQAELCGRTDAVPATVPAGNALAALSWGGAAVLPAAVFAAVAVRRRHRSQR